MRYTSYFRTSKYKTFAAKYAALAFANDWQWAVKGLPGVQDIGRTVAGDELFDAFEAKGTAQMQPLVMIAAGQHTPWHQSINRLVYDNAAPKYAGLSIQWHDGTRPAHLSMPPINALLLDQVAQGLQLSDAMISSGLATSSSGKVAYVYQLPFYMYYDYYYLQQAAANSTQDTEGIRYLLDTPFLPMTKGQYPVYVGYRLPGKDEANSLQHFMINKP